MLNHNGVVQRRILKLLNDLHFIRNFRTTLYNPLNKPHLNIVLMNLCTLTNLRKLIFHVSFLFLAVNASSMNDETTGINTSMLPLVIVDDNIPVCDGTALEITINGLPTSGVDQFQISYSVGATPYNHFTALGATGLSGSYTFTTNYVADLADIGMNVTLSVSFQDPFGSPIPLGVNNASAPILDVDPLPQGTIAATVPGQTICEEEDWSVTFTATQGTGPFELMINGISINTDKDGNDLDSGDELYLAEGGPAFTGDLQTITLEKIIDLGSANNCESLPNQDITGPTVNNMDPGSISADQTICDGDDPAAFNSMAAIVDGTISYEWEESIDGAVFSSTGVFTETYDSGPLSEDMYFRRKATSVFNGVSCDKYSNTVLVQVNNVTAGSITDNGEHICPYTDASMINLSGTSGDAATLDIQWYESTDNVSFTPIMGETGMSFTPTDLTQTTYYKVEVESTVNSVTCSDESNVVMVEVSVAGGTNGQISNTDAASDHCTIQDAINNASPGDNLLINTADYTEYNQIVVDKNISLSGLGKLNTVLRPGMNTGSSGDARGFILVDTGVSFDLESLTINGQGFLVYQAIRNKGEGSVG